MRYREFLLEYRRDVTAQKMGDNILKAFNRIENGSTLPDNLYGAWTVLDMVLRPAYHFEDTIKMDVLGQMTAISKKTAPEILEKIKPALIDQILTLLESADPTQNKEYSQWIAARYITGDTKIEDIISTLQEYLYKFNILKRKKLIAPPANDINRYSSFTNLMDVLDEYELPEDDIVNKGKVTEVYDDADVRVVVPEDQQAACYYGKGTRWCTAATKGTNYYGHYSRQGPLYILLPKKPNHTGEKYQLHFPSDQFMDESDYDASVVWLLGTRFPNLEQFFRQQEPELNNFIVFSDNATLQPLLDKIKEKAIDYMWDEVSEWEYQDDYFKTWQAEQAIELGYVDDDGDVDWDKVHDDDTISNYLDFNEDLRSIVNEVQTALDYGAQGVKDFILNDRDGEVRDNYLNSELNKLPDVLARLVNYETGGRRHDSNFVADYIDRYISVDWDRTSQTWSIRRV